MNQNNPNWGQKNLWIWNDLCCHWRVLGNKKNPPLVLIHGFGASSSHWRNNAEYFAKAGFIVYSLDLIGFGESEQPSPRKIKKMDNHFWSMQVAAFLQEIVRTNQKHKAILLGNSLGGLTALTTAALYPHLTKAVIAAPLPDPALTSKFTQKNFPKWLSKFNNIIIYIFFKIVPLEIFIPLIIKTNLINIAIQSAYYKSVKNDYDLKNLIIQPAIRRTAPQALRAMCIGMASRRTEHTAPFLLNRITSFKTKIPLLLAWGKEDKLVPFFIGKNIINQFPSLELIVIKHSGHCPHDESSSKFNQYVLHWLKNNIDVNKQKP